MDKLGFEPYRYGYRAYYGKRWIGFVWKGEHGWCGQNSGAGTYQGKTRREVAIQLAKAASIEV